MDNNQIQPSIPTGNPPPPPDTPIVATSEEPKKKIKTGKVLATLFGFGLLLAGAGAGLLLVQQNQQIKQHAAGTVPDGQSSGCCSNTSQCQSWFGSASVCGSGNNGACQSGNQCIGSNNCTPTHQCTNSDCGVSNGCGQTCNGGCNACGGSGQACCIGNQNACNNGFHCVQASQTCVADTSSGSNWTQSGNCITVTSGTVDLQRFSGSSCPTTQNNQGTQTVGPGTYCTTPSQGSCQQIDVVNLGNGVCSCNTTTSSPKPTPTATPNISASCTNIGAYDTNWNPLTSAQLSALKAGSVVRFSVIGTTTGSFDKARFTVNGTLQPETSLTHSLNTQTLYYFDYTLPANVTSYTVVAQLHSVQLNDWF